MKKKAVCATMILAILAALVLAGCAPGSGHFDPPSKPAGFFSGVWHGWIAPVSLIAGIFNHHIRVYEVNNTGWWYDFGFYMAIVGGFGGLALSRKIRRR